VCAIVLTENTESKENRRMRVRQWIGTIVAFALTAIAAVATPAGPSFSYGIMQNSCAPTDAPAIAIMLTTEPAQCKRVTGPFLSFAIWRDLPIHSGQVFEFGSGSSAGYAALCAKEGDCKRAESARIVFDNYQERSNASGHYELQVKGGETLKGSFEVKWCEKRVICW
jgi:hypothetical protein